MPLNPEQVRKWFGFNRQERRGSFILVIIIIVLLVVRIITPVTTSKIEDITPEINALIYPAGENFNGSPDSKGKIIRTAAFREEYKNADNNNVQEFKAGSKTSRNTQKQYKSRSPIDLNACDSAALESLPGIGPVLSVRILKYRNLLGGYASVSQLTEVYGLPPETYEMIKGRLFADSLSVKKINVNSVGYKELSRFPYLESYDVTAILKFRQIQNKIQNLEELVKNNVLAPEKAARIKPYLAFE